MSFLIALAGIARSESAGPAEVDKAFRAFITAFQARPGQSGTSVSFWLARKSALNSNSNSVKLFACEENRNMLPASTLKIVTAASVLEHFGPTDRLTTRLYWDGNQLVLVGAGDPELNTAAMESLARQAAPRLPRQVKRLLVDARRFSQPCYPPGWSGDDLQKVYAPEVRALLIEHEGIPFSPTTGYAVPWLNEALRRTLEPSLHSPSLHEGRVVLNDSDLATGHALRWALGQEGIKLEDVARVENAAPAATGEEIANQTSRPVYEILRQGLAVSDNLVMECLHRLCREERPLRLQGPNDVRIVDGSGLSRYNLISTRLLGETVLETPGLVDLLPVPGGNGTLSKRFLSTPLEGHLHAKTGTMSGVSGLVGEFSLGDWHYAFAMLINGSVGPVRPLKKAEDVWLTTLYGLLSGERSSVQDSKTRSRAFCTPAVGSTAEPWAGRMTQRH